MRRTAILFFLMLTTISGFGQGVADRVSPLDYGLREATTGVARYYALYTAHTEALNRGIDTVSYAGIDTIDLELPPVWQTIPLTRITDFAGVVINVTNNAHHGALFGMYNSAHGLEMDKRMIEGGYYGSIPQLANGMHLLVLADEHPWTERRGYGYKHYRRDLVVVNNGIAINNTIAPWNGDSTQLKASYYDVDTVSKSIRGLTMHRTKGSTFKTYCVAVTGQNNLTIADMHVTTPRSKMIADAVFSVQHSANVSFKDVRVDGTYSGYGSTRDYGYAFSLNNDWGTYFERVVADGNWGVFGTNNLNLTELVDCDINRFDIHCYGRDASLTGCTLRQRQTQFSSMYGTVEFVRCRFIDCIPVRIRSSYNAYTPFNIVMDDCTFELTPRYHSLVNVMLLDTADNPRPELARKCWPNLTIDRMTVVVPITVGSMNLFHPTGTLSELNRRFGHISRVTVNGLKMVRPNGSEVKVPLRLSSRKFKTEEELFYNVR